MPTNAEASNRYRIDQLCPKVSDMMSQRILVIEGDPALRDKMWRLLCDYGHQVDLAANGVQAVGQSLRSRFDTVIMDLSLTDIGGSFLAGLLEADGARGPAPSLIGLVELRYSPAVRSVCGGLFKAILSKPLRSAALLDAINAACIQPTAMAAGLASQRQGRYRIEAPHAARDLSKAHWRRWGLQTRPRVFACPRPTMDQEKALKLCFDMVSPRDADLIILLERHGMSEAKRLAPFADKIHRPVIALSPDHSDLCEAVFEITSETSWRQIASLVRRGQTPSAIAPQVETELGASASADRVMPQTHEKAGDDMALPQTRPFDGGPNILREVNQKRVERAPLAGVGESAGGAGDHGKTPVKTEQFGNQERPSYGWNADAQVRAGAHVLLIEGNEIGSPGLTLALARAGHIICRVQDPQASRLAAAGTLFDVGVIDVDTSSEPHIDLLGLVRSLRGVQRGLPIILVGSELGKQQRHDIARAGGISLLAKASAQENLVEAVSAAICDGSPRSHLSGVH